MTVILNGSTNPGQDDKKIILTYLVDDRESTALGTIFDGLFEQVIKQVFANTETNPTIIKNKETNQE